MNNGPLTTAHPAGSIASRIVIHGAPAGFEAFPEGTGSEFLRQFYQTTGSGAGTLMRAELSMTPGGMPECVYTFLRFGLLDSSGRPGSYVGLSAFVNRYYDDLGGMYELLNALFKKYLLGEVISPDARRYEAPGLAGKAELFGKLEREFDGSVDPRRFVPIAPDPALPRRGSKLAYNKDEVNDPAARDLVLSGGVVVIDNAVPLSRERETLSRLDSLGVTHREETERLLEGHRAEIRRQSEDFGQALREKETLIASLRSENKGKDLALEEFRKKTDLVLSKLSEASALMSDAEKGKSERRHREDKPGGHSSRRKGGSLLIPAYRVLVLILLSLLLYLSFARGENAPSSSAYPAPAPPADSVVISGRP